MIGSAQHIYNFISPPSQSCCNKFKILRLLFQMISSVSKKINVQMISPVTRWILCSNDLFSHQVDVVFNDPFSHQVDVAFKWFLQSPGGWCVQWSLQSPGGCCIQMISSVTRWMVCSMIPSVTRWMLRSNDFFSHQVDVVFRSLLPPGGCSAQMISSIWMDAVLK